MSKQQRNTPIIKIAQQQGLGLPMRACPQVNGGSDNRIMSNALGLRKLIRPANQTIKQHKKREAEASRCIYG
jgi:hypothetical protein